MASEPGGQALIHDKALEQIAAQTNITFDPPAILRAERDPVVQGTAAELLQLAIMRVDRALVHTGARMIAAVHDELVLEWPEADVATVAPRVVAEMIAAYRTLIP